MSIVCDRCGADAGIDVAVCPECGFSGGDNSFDMGATVADGPGRGGGGGRDHTVMMHEATVAGGRRANSGGMLVVRAGPQAGKAFDLEDRNLIGRDSTCSIRLTDRRVSGVHGNVRKLGERFVYQDLQATNSSFLVLGAGRERRLTTAHTLRDGDELRLGDSVLRFVDLQGGRRR